MESKKEIYDLMPDHFYPRTLAFEPGVPPEQVISRLRDAHFRFPLIGKPDIGMRGMGVEKLEDESRLLQYISSSRVRFLLQEFVPYEMEAGLFYYRYPGEPHGHISGIVFKDLLSIEGDGRSTVLELLQQNPRHILQIRKLKKQQPELLQRILPRAQNEILVPYGNHSRGARFIDASDHITSQLTATMDRICQQIEGFYFGRLDIRFRSWEELALGRNFSIIELNGAGSEPTHIYDPGHSLFFAWKEIIRHWNILFVISRQNKKRWPYMSFHSGIRMFRENRVHVRLLNADELRA